MSSKEWAGDIRHEARGRIRPCFCELIVNVSAVMPGSITDWPANVQDGVYAALERVIMRSHIPYEIVASYSDVDVDTGPYIRVIGQAIQVVQ